MRHSDRRFSLHYSFPFYLHNVLNVIAVSQSAKFNVANSSSEALQVTSRDLEEAFRYHKEKSKDPSLVHSNPTVVALERRLAAVGRHVPGSDYVRKSLQGEMKALMVLLGQPSFFITVNPADLHHPLTLHYGGKDIDLDTPFLRNWLKKSKRLELVAEDPVAVARMFNKLIEVWLETVLGVQKRGSNRRGILGRVSGYFGTVETQNRGSLHLHMLVWMHGAISGDIVADRLADGSDFAASLQAYLSKIIFEEFPDGVPADDDFHDDPDKSVACARPPHPQDDDFDLRAKERLTKLVKACNVHKHTATCYKYGYDNCRFDFPRPSVDVAGWKDGVLFLRRRANNSMVNNYNDVTTMLLGCNTDIKWLCNGADSKAVSFYITSYITKKTMTSENAFPLLISAAKAVEDGIHSCRRNTQLFTEVQQNSHDLLVKCLNRLTTFTERSGAEVACLLLGLPLHYTDYKFTKVFIHHLVTQLDHQDAVDEAIAAGKPPPVHDDVSERMSLLRRLDDDGLPELCLNNQRNDYQLRIGGFLVCLYEFTKCYIKVKLSALSAKQRTSTTTMRFSDVHPQANTHCMVFTPNSFRVPCVCGPSFPCRENNPVKWAKLFMVLFKPFVNLEDIKPSGMSWPMAFDEWWVTLLPDDLTSLTRYCA